MFKYKGAPIFFIFCIFIVIFLMLSTTIHAFTVSGEFKVQPGEVGKEGGGGGGGKIIPQEPKEKICESLWECGEWGECENFVRTRKCIDINKCVDYEKEEKAPCIPIKQAAVYLKTPVWFLILIIILVLIALLLIAILIILLLTYKREKQKKKQKHKKQRRKIRR